MTATTVDLRCSSQAREQGLQAIGSATAADAFLLVEVPLPWPSDIADHPRVIELAALASELGARVQAVVPDASRAVEGTVQVVLHQRESGPFRGYRRREATIGADDLVAGVRRLADDKAASPRRDILICAHGSRDRCCGSFGTTLHVASGATGGADRRLWRTSHLGGHRFASTALVLPEGTMWAWLDPELLDAVVSHRVHPRHLVDHYRGSTAMTHPALQVTEREIFARLGWPWLDAHRAGHVLDQAADRWIVRVESSAGAWRAVVERIATLPQPLCGASTPSQKPHDQLRLVELREDA